MSKLTFMQYLLEVDASDLELVKQKMDKDSYDSAEAKAKDQFTKEMGSSPRKGDTVQSKSGKYKVKGMNKNGFVLGQQNGKNGILPHGTKFKEMGRELGGGRIFQVVS